IAATSGMAGGLKRSQSAGSEGVGIPDGERISPDMNSWYLTISWRGKLRRGRPPPERYLRGSPLEPRVSAFVVRRDARKSCRSFDTQFPLRHEGPISRSFSLEGPSS